MSDLDPKIVTRFAPSPTGYLHIGGARTALFNWAFARKHHGTFILRMEDTDKARSTDEATRRILEDLRWLGIDWDQGPEVGGPHAPYFQSQRSHLYKQYLQRLIDAGRAYEDAKGGGAYRFKMPGKAITVHDLVLGDVTIEPGQLEDFIIMKGELSGGGGGPTFHFANVVDDATMGVTHVLRAQEHLMNTPKHLALFEALGITPPRYAHMPLIFNADGSKMSKRDKAKVARTAAKAHLAKAQGLPPLGITPPQLEDFLNKKTDDSETAAAIAAALNVTLPEIDVHDFRVNGYLPQVILNYIALLGWSPEGKDDAGGERFGRDYVAQHFTVERIGKTNARFDRAKLLAFNAEAIAKMAPDAFRELLGRFAQERFPSEWSRLSGPASIMFSEAYRPRSRTLAHPFELGRFFFVSDDKIVYDRKAVEKELLSDNGKGLSVLRAMNGVIDSVDWSYPNTQTIAHQIQQNIADFAKASQLSMGDVAQPLRVAVSGSTVSPPIHETLAILGKDATLKRIERCLALTGS